MMLGPYVNAAYPEASVVSCVIKKELDQWLTILKWGELEENLKV